MIWQSGCRELEQIWGIAAWCIIPSGHREDSGFGRFWKLGEDQSFQLRSVAGNWVIRRGNQFEKTDEPLAWAGNDTLFWSGGQSVQLLPLGCFIRDRSDQGSGNVQRHVRC